MSKTILLTMLCLFIGSATPSAATLTYVDLVKKLTDLDGLNGVTSLTGYGSNCEIEDAPLTISGNSALTNVDGLSNLHSLIGGAMIGTLFIVDNAALTNLDGLQALTSAVDGPLEIGNNPDLPQCEACDLVDQLIDFEAFNFYGNQPDTCNDTCD